MTETLRGELLDFRVRNTTDFWGTGSVRTLHDRGEVAITGKLIGINPGDTVELEGDFATSKYGRQFKVKNARVVLPSDVRGVVGWLAAKLPQISARRAEELVQHFGVDPLWAILDKGDGAALCVIDGITLKRAEEIVAAYRVHRADRDRMVRFKQWGLTDNQAARVIKEWGDKAEDKLTANPYDLIRFVDGFGWSRADQIAMRMCVRRDDPARIGAALLHSMDIATQGGHCFVPMGKLVAITTKGVCGLEDQEPVRRVLGQLIQRGKLKQDEQNVLLPDIDVAEDELAAEFAERADARRFALRAEQLPARAPDNDVGEDWDDWVDGGVG